MKEWFLSPFYRRACTDFSQVSYTKLNRTIRLLWNPETCIYSNVRVQSTATLQFWLFKFNFLSTTPLPSFHLLYPPPVACAGYVSFASSIFPSQEGPMTRLIPGPKTKAKMSKDGKVFMSGSIRQTSHEETHTCALSEWNLMREI